MIIQWNKLGRQESAFKLSPPNINIPEKARFTCVHIIIVRITTNKNWFWLHRSQCSYSMYKISSALLSIKYMRKRLVLLDHLVLGQGRITLYRIFLEITSIEEELMESSAKEMYLEPEIGLGLLFYRLSLHLLKWQCLSMEEHKLLCQAMSIP